MFSNWLTWAVIAAILFTYEMISPTVFFFACLGLGAIFASIVSIFNLMYLNWVVFFVVSLLAIIFSRPVVNKLMKKPSRPANVDMLINQNAVVLEEIKPTKFGRVKIDGEEWLADASEEIPKGATVKIIEIKGVRVVVKRQGNGE